MLLPAVVDAVEVERSNNNHFLLAPDLLLYNLPPWVFSPPLVEMESYENEDNALLNRLCSSSLVSSLNPPLSKRAFVSLACMFIADVAADISLPPTSRSSFREAPRKRKLSAVNSTGRISFLKHPKNIRTYRHWPSHRYKQR
jgi:hypothetical protein